eukprot:gene50413-biopygen41214
MDDQTVGADHVHRPAGFIQPVSLVELGGTKIAQKGNARRQLTKFLTQARRTACLERHALRSDSHGDVEVLARYCNIAIDLGRALRAACHRTDDERRFDPFSEKLRRQGDLVEGEFGEGHMLEGDVIEGAAASRPVGAPASDDLQRGRGIGGSMNRDLGQPALTTPGKAPDISQAREALERRLAHLVETGPGAPPHLRGAVRHALLAPSKRVRSLILHLFAAEGDPDAEAALAAGCAIEMVHTATLIIDDLPCMDHATTLRQLPTQH